MPYSRPHPYHRKRNVSRRKLRLIYARPGWDLVGGTAPKYRYFDSLQDAMDFVRRLYAWKRAQPGLLAKLEEQDGGRGWREIPLGEVGSI